MSKKRLGQILPWLVLVCCYLFTVGVLALYGEHNIDADMASEMMLADLLNSEGRFITDSWYYSTELRVVSPVPVYQLALRIFPDNWHAARVASLAVILACVAASMIYMARGAGMGDAAVYAAGVILLPVSGIHKFLFSLGGFYTVYVIQGALIIGLTLRTAGRIRVWRLVLLAMLGLWGGLAGVRMPMIVGVPLFAACALSAFGQLEKKRSLRALFHTEQGRMAIGAGVMLAAMFAGYLINTRVYALHYHFEQYEDMAFSMPSVSLLLEQIVHIAEFFGYGSSTQWLSAGGLVQSAMLLVTAGMGVSVCLLLAKWKRLSARERVIVLFTLCAVGLGMFLNVITGKMKWYAVGYYMLGLFSLVALLFFTAERMAFQKAWVGRATMAILAGVFLMQGTMFARNRIEKTYSAHEEAAAWLLENGYQVGYASFWNGNLFTEISDGEIEVYVYGVWQDQELCQWLQHTNHFEQLPEGPVFCFVSGEEYFSEYVPVADEAHLAWVSEHYGSRIYVYESAQQVELLQRAQP